MSSYALLIILLQGGGEHEGLGFHGGDSQVPTNNPLKNLGSKDDPRVYI